MYYYAVIIVMILILIITSHECNRVNYIKSISKINYDDIDFNTGDIITFSYQYHNYSINYFKMLATCVPNWSNVHTHIAMIIKIGGIPYIINSGPQKLINYKNEYTSHQVDIYNLHDYISKYQGYVFYSKINMTPNIGKIDHLIGIPYKANVQLLINYLLGINTGMQNHMTCTGLVRYLLSYMKLLPCTQYINNYTPSDILSEITDLYSKPKLIL